jgi:hypothetical protein
MDDRLTLTSGEIAPFTLDFIRQRLYVARTLVPQGWDSYFRRQAVYRSVHTSTAIEGNQLKLPEAMAVMVDEPQTLTAEQLEVKNPK